MKKLITFLLVICLIFCLTACGSSLDIESSDIGSDAVSESVNKQTAENESSLNSTSETEIKEELSSEEITGSLPLSVDLNNSGTEETVELISDSNSSTYTLQITNQGSTSGNTDICSNCKIWLKDIDNDLIYDFIICGQSADGSYKTYFYKYDKDGLTTIPVSNVTDTETDSVAFNGWVYSLSDTDTTLATNLNVLGSYVGIEQFNYDNGYIEPAFGSNWTIIDNTDWLTLVQDLPVTKSDGNGSKLQAGEKIQIKSTNNSSWASYTTENGDSGIIHISKDENDSWTIKGISETDYFGSLT